MDHTIERRTIGHADTDPIFEVVVHCKSQQEAEALLARLAKLDEAPTEDDAELRVKQLRAVVETTLTEVTTLVPFLRSPYSTRMQALTEVLRKTLVETAR